jgi:hypothetical protein
MGGWLTYLSGGKALDYGLTFRVAFTKWITVINLVAIFYSNRDAAKVLVEIYEQKFIGTFVSQIHLQRVCK